MNQLTTAEKWEKVREALNLLQKVKCQCPSCVSTNPLPVLTELQQEHERLRKALEPFAEVFDNEMADADSWRPMNDELDWNTDIQIKAFREARAALGEKE